MVLNSQRNGRLTEMTRMNSKVQEIAHKRALLFNKVDRGHCLNGNCPSCDKASLFSQYGQTGGQLAACTLELDKRRSRRVGVCDLADQLPHGQSRLWEQRNADFKTAPAPGGLTLVTLTCAVAWPWPFYLCIPDLIGKRYDC
ncbi:hypothetical protein T4C_6456 [Trichinella pseudospiralis]|uniref:Uncharacterized protein n=1 Tax=Trichinella pseudospiralis TaxID=6337 RepID=A0A0V1IV77_TRIPS|nr:hypothetical protein T4C_5351 [Trichinella pseudospiralis]KRZ26524.1 hypothetical protein T4C_6456 [Trichinella pseudospiralis]